MAHHDSSSRAQLWDLIKDIKFGMFTTAHSSGHMHARPMTTQNRRVDEDNALWFFMPRDSETVADLKANASVNVSYAHPGKDSYVSVSGTAQVVEDAVKKEQLWNKFNEAWFPQGVNDPNLALVQVHMTQADYWDVKSSKLVQLFAMAKASLTGRPATDLGEHAEVRLR